MSIEENKAVGGRWFAEFWGKDYTLPTSLTTIYLSVVTTPGILISLLTTLVPDLPGLSPRK